MLLIDRSGSMDEEVTFGGRLTTKAQAVASVANALIDELINNCQRGRGVGDYFDLAVIGYGGDKATTLWGSGFRRITDVYSMPTTTLPDHIKFTLPDGTTTECIIERRCWVEPTAKGRTPMGDALRTTRKIVAAWCKRNPTSFPPLVINITDGEATDATEEELLALADKIKSTATTDGNTLLFNIHIASEWDNVGPTVWFPSEGEPLPDNRYSRMLWQMSSQLPAIFDQTISQLKEHPCRPPYRAMCYNCPATQLFALLNIGSISIEKMI